MKDINKFANELFNSSGLSVNPSHDIHDLCSPLFDDKIYKGDPTIRHNIGFIFVNFNFIIE